MTKRRLGRTDLHIAPLVFGANVFGWTADERTSFDLLDRFVVAGLNAIDTADAYGKREPVRTVGDSEAIIGDWLKRSGRRNEVLIITKVGHIVQTGGRDLTAAYIERAAEASLKRLKTDVIDLYFAHWPDPKTPHEETLRAFENLRKAGKVRAIGASNYDAALLRAALDAAKKASVPRYEVIQPEYNLYDRSSFEGPLRDLVLAEEIGVITYGSLGRGFFSGKYRSADDLGQSVRGERVKNYINPRGFRILATLEEIARRHGTGLPEIALAWVAAKPGVTAPIASATSLAQLESLIRSVSVDLSPADIAALDDAGRD